jgi:hypothetical protein
VALVHGRSILAAAVSVAGELAASVIVERPEQQALR